jgi:hypothetical protein
MKLANFKAKFISEGEMHTDDTPYVFPKDKSLKEKLPGWSAVFMSLLVKRVCETDGEVLDCPQVIEASQKYRQGQDAFSGFIADCIVAVPNNTYGIGQQILNNAFKEWHQMHFGNKKVPKLADLLHILSKKFGPMNEKTKKWYNFKIRNEDELDDANGL